MVEDPDVDCKRTIQGIVAQRFPDLDDYIREYFISLLSDNPILNKEELQLALGPFLTSIEYASNENDVDRLCEGLFTSLSKEYQKEFEEEYDENGNKRNRDEVPVLLSAPVSLKENDKTSSTDAKMMDLMWGRDKIRNARNELMDRKVVTNKRQERKQRQALQALEDSDDEEEGEQISAMVLPDYSSGSGEKDINVLGFGLRFSGKELISRADLKLAYGRRYGLVGKNGIGKTTLLKHMASFEIEGFPRHHRVLHVKQEVKSTWRSVIDVVLESDVERSMLLNEEKEILARQNDQDITEEQPSGEPQDKDGGSPSSSTSASNQQGEADQKRLTEIYARLDIIGANNAEARARLILNGLQFTPEMQAGPVSDLSGGWRMRVTLAGALFIEPDLLLLDEPTNHLDLEAVLWLQDYLATYKHTILLVSHDRAFLNEVCTDIMQFKDFTLTYYKGDYDTFEQVRAEKYRNARKMYEAYEQKRAHMQEFIDTFRYNAKRAALVQSRIKALAKLEIVEEPEEEAGFSFFLPTPEPLGRPVLAIQRVSFGYPTRQHKQLTNSNDNNDSSDNNKESADGETATTSSNSSETVVTNMILNEVDFGVDLQTRIGIVGPNGAGKSTLLNLILDKLNPLKGHVYRHGSLRLSAFTQHHEEMFDLKLSALDNFLKFYPENDPQDLRAAIGRFGISGLDCTKPMKMLSGGQKSRVSFALLAYRRPHILIMDEPTNHLDMETIDALIEALRNYRGGLVVVSHDQHFISSVCEDIWICGEGKLLRFQGSFIDYKKKTLLETKKKTATANVGK